MNLIFNISWLLCITTSFTLNAALGKYAAQTPTQFPQVSLSSDINESQDYQPNVFEGGLSSLSIDQFSVLSHPLFPSYAVRVKKTRFCDNTVNAYTGYIDIGAKHLFFYFFESRNEPDSDDVIFWTNGGPGCSSSLGLLMELGPCRIHDSNSTKFNPYSWNSKANIFFIDQPVGVGFSYAEYGEYVSTTEEAAKDIAAFVAIFFESFSQFEGRGFHMAGESYGGRYIPVFASTVYDQNAILVENGLTPINLKSVMIGNGMTDTYRMIQSYYDLVCTPASVDPVLDVGTCVRMKTALPRCRVWMKEACIDTFDAMNCQAAMGFCSEEIERPFFLSGKNPYDISKDCEGRIEDTLCYPITRIIRDYLDQPGLRADLGVDQAIGQFKSCSNDVGTAFALTLDVAQPTQLWVAELLERNIRALIYVGTYDWICNWVGNNDFTMAMQWSGQEQFRDTPLLDWHVDGNYAGQVRSLGPLTFLTISGAGHMVPFDKPVEALRMIETWLDAEVFD